MPKRALIKGSKDLTKEGRNTDSSKNKAVKYALLVFFMWVIAPLLLASIVYMINKALLNPKFFLNLLIPGAFFAVITYFISQIKNSAIKKGSFYAIIGAIIWASPSIYFLPASSFYASLSSTLQLIVIIVPTVFFAVLFFEMGKNQVNTQEDLGELYLKRHIFSNT